MKIAYVGFGKSTHRYHMPFVDKAKDFDVVGYYTTSGREFDMPYPPLANSIERFDDFNEMLATDVEVIAITTPATFHYQYAKEALLAGKHVLVEKPLCDTLEQAQELYALAKEQGVKLAPYQNRRFDSDFLTIKEILARDDIGKVMEIESNHTHYRPGGAANRGNMYDGSVFGHAVHFVDQIVSLFGEPDEIIYDICNQKNYYIGEGMSYGDKDIPEDYYDIKFIYGNMRVRIRHSQLIVNDPPRWIINATESTTEKYWIDQQETYLKKGLYLDHPDFGIDTPDGLCKIYFRDRTVQVPAKYVHYTEYYNQFAAWLQGKADAPVTENEALIVIHILETIAGMKKYQPLGLK